MAYVFVLFRQLRPKQWAKNLLILAPLLFSGKITDCNAAYAAFLCFAGFCAVSSSTYTVNDLIDFESDSRHPTKKARPIAARQLNRLTAVLLALLCAIVGLYLSYCVRPSVSLVLVAYLSLNLAYTFSWKRFAIIDVLCISTGFVLRAVAGAIAVGVQPSEWFLLCTTLGAMFLALEKRRHELISLAGDSDGRRVALQQYSATLLIRMENLVLPSLVTCYAFYSFLSFHGKLMMLTMPFVLYGIMRYQHLSERGEVTGTPEDVFWHDKPIQFALLGWFITSFLVVYGDPGLWAQNIAHVVDCDGIKAIRK